MTFVTRSTPFCTPGARDADAHAHDDQHVHGHLHRVGQHGR